MRSLTRQVPGQLHSVSVRYRHDLAYCRAGVHMANGIGLPPVAALSNSASDGTGQRDERLVRLEAVLFLSREPLSSRRLSQYANLADATEARTLIRRLNEILDLRGRAFRVEEVAGGYQFLTRPKFASWLRRLANVPKELRLSAPGLETLAVIAYRQPASRAEIEAVRGVNCGEIVRQLLERDLVRMAGRSDELGRPYLYATTRRFLQLFGLRSLDDLPRSDQLRKPDPTHNSGRQSTDTTGIKNTTGIRNTTDSSDRNEEEFEVTATIRAELSPEELRKSRRGGVPSVLPRASDDEGIIEGDKDEEDDDEFDDLDDDDEEEDLDDDDDDDEEFDDVDDEEGFEEEEWEEVDDDEEDDLDDDEEDDWDDDDEEDDEEEESWE